MAFASGIGTYIRNVIPEVLKYAGARGVRFQILYDPAAPELLDLIGRDGAFFTACSAPPFSLAEQRVVPALISRRSRLLWVPHFNVPLNYLGRLAATIHDVLPLAMPQFMYGLHRRVAARLLFRQITRRAAGVLCDSRFTASELMRLTGLNPTRLHSIPLGVGASWSSISTHGLLRDRPYFLFVGNVKPHKNLSRLVEAFVNVSAKIPHDLLIVGRKEGFSTGDRKFGRWTREPADRVFFTGQVSRSELEQYYAGATALIFPSLYEGFGLPALEAMAAGCPVLAAHAAALPEVCGEAALYCNPLDSGDIGAKMVALAQDDSLRRKLIQLGREHAATYSWQQCGERTAQVLVDLIAAG